MTHNPYGPPGSDPVPTPTPRDIPLVTNILGLVCVLPGFGMLLGAVVFPSELVRTFAETPVKAGIGLALGVAAVVAGGALFAWRPLAVPAFAVGLALAALSLALPGGQDRPSAFWAGVLLAGLAYSSWLKSRGVLRSPAGRRGAAA